MLSDKCPICGKQTEIDIRCKDTVKCAACSSPTEVALNPQDQQAVKAAREKTKRTYINILEKYKQGNNVPLNNELTKVINHANDPFFDLGFTFDGWYEFIMEAARLSTDQNDSDTVSTLRRHAAQFDAAYENCINRNNSLHDILIFYSPSALRDELARQDELQNAMSNRSHLMAVLSDLLEDMQETNKPHLITSFITNIADEITKSSHNDLGRNYLKIILNDDKISRILSVSFFMNAENALFIKKLSHYVKKDFKDDNDTLKGTLVWQNFEKAQKKKIKKIAIFSSAVAVSIAVITSCIFGFLNSVDPESISITGKGLINMEYKEEPDLSAYSIVYSKRNGKEITIPVTPEMLSDYDAEKIGTQSAKITFKNKSFDVTLHVSAYKLQKTTAMISGNTLIWDRIEHATEYHIYFSENSSSAGDALYARVTDCFYDLGTVDMGTTFYASVVAAADSNKYERSDKSDSIMITKLASPSGITYDKDNGMLKWDAVEGADHYMVVVNEETIQNVKNNEYAVTLKLGENKIAISAFSIDPNVIVGTSEQKTIYKLSPVENVAYIDDKITWSAENEASRYNIYCDGQPLKLGHNGKAIDVSELSEGLHTMVIEVAADSLSKIDSDPYEFKIQIGAHLEVTSNMLDWSALNGTSFDVYVDNQKFASELTASNKEISSFEFGVGEHKIYIVVKDDNSISETVTIKRLAKPKFSLQAQSLSVSGLTANCEVRIDNTVYTGDYSKILDTLREAKTYTITAINKATNNREIDSDMERITVKRIAPPVISVNNGELSAKNASSVAWYVDGIRLDDLSLITEGQHKVYAVSLTQEENALNSFRSNELTVVKLPTPTLAYTKTPERMLRYEFNTLQDYDGKIVYYKNGEEWDADLDSLSGSNEITAVYMSKGGNVLNSELSNMVLVVTTNVNLSVAKSGENQITLLLKEGEIGLSYKLEVAWYDGDQEISSTSYDKTEFTSTTMQRVIPTNRSGKAATRIEITVKIYASDGSEADVLIKTWER